MSILWGHLHLVIGPMRANKSGWLNEELTRYADLDKSVIKIMHNTDQRTDITSKSNKGSSHSSGGVKLSDKVDIYYTNNLEEVDVTNYQIIGIDEAQFFNNLVDNVTKYLKLGKFVRVAGLDGDFLMKPFGEVLNLIPLANIVEKRTAFCQFCIQEQEENNNNLVIAPYSLRLTCDKEQKIIGGDDLYASVCGKHYQMYIN
jgi:thymidine kinase